MSTPLNSKSCATVSVLPTSRHKPLTYLDAATALDLAILGATACRMTPLARLVDTVWCLTGGGWRPPQDVVHEALRAANAAGAAVRRVRAQHPRVRRREALQRIGATVLRVVARSGRADESQSQRREEKLHKGGV